MLAVAGLTSAGSVRADDSATVRRAFQAIAARMVRADTSGDADLYRKVYQAVYAPGFTFTLPDGKTLTREQYLETRLHELPQSKGSQEGFKILRVMQKGNRATVDGLVTYRIVQAAPAAEPGAKGAAHVVSGHNTFRSHLVKAGGVWQALNVTILSVQPN